MNNLISVIIPVYNVEKYLVRCIESVLTQTYKEFEVIIIEDGSTDNSREICKEYSLKEGRIKVIYQENRGVSAARNTGVEIAKGKYIMFLDSDDYIEKNFLNDAFNQIESAGAQLYISSYYEEWYEENKLIKIEEKKCIKTTYNLEGLFQNIRKEYPPMAIYGPCFKLYVTNIIKANEIKFPMEVSIGEDTLFNYEYLRYCRKIITTDNCYYHYIKYNSRSLTRKYHHNFYEINLQIIEKLNEINHYQISISEDIVAKEYFFRMIDCICDMFRHKKNTTFKIRKKLINTVSKNKYISKLNYKSDIFTSREKVILFFLRYKMTSILYLLLNIWYIFLNNKYKKL